MSPYILCENFQFLKPSPQKKYFKYSFTDIYRAMFFQYSCSSIRNWSAYANEAIFVNNDPAIGTTWYSSGITREGLASQYGPIPIRAKMAATRVHIIKVSCFCFQDNIENVSYVWALCRDQSILDHRSAWRVLEFGIQNSSSWLWQAPSLPAPEFVL